MERKTSLVTSVVRVTQPSNIYKFTCANIPVRNLIAVRNVKKHLLTQVLWKITRNSTNTTSRSHVRYVERLLRSRRTWTATWWYNEHDQQLGQPRQRGAQYPEKVRAFSIYKRNDPVCCSFIRCKTWWNSGYSLALLRAFFASYPVSAEALSWLARNTAWTLYCKFPMLSTGPN